MAEVDLKKFLREHGFRHDGDHDRGAYWTNGDVRITVRKSFDKEPGLLRALMEQIRDHDKKKQRRLAAEKKAYEEHEAKVASAIPDPPFGWPSEAPTMSTKGLIAELIGRGWENGKIVRVLNEQNIRHPMGSLWTINELQDWFPSTRLKQRPETPEEHREAQVEAAKEAQTPPVVTTDGKVTRKKFSGDERKYVFGRLKAMLNAKMETSKICAALTAEGIRQPNGKLIDTTYVAGMRNNWAAKPSRAAAYAEILVPRIRPGTPTPPPPPRPVVVAPPLPPSVPRSRFNLPLSVDTLLHDKEVSDDERLQVLMIFVEVPSSAYSLLGDHTLPVAQKIAVIEAVGKRRKKNDN